MTHLHTVEGCNSHVEEDTVEHGHGNELWDKSRRAQVNNLPIRHATVNTWWVGQHSQPVINSNRTHQWITQRNEAIETIKLNKQ